MVVDVPRQGDGEHAVMGGVATAIEKIPFLLRVVEKEHRRVPACPVHGDYTAF